MNLQVCAAVEPEFFLVGSIEGQSASLRRGQGKNQKNYQIWLILSLTICDPSQLMRLFAVKLILSYEQKYKGQNFSKIKVCLQTNFDINSMSSLTQTDQ